MKFLMSELLSTEDAEKFMREHEGCGFVNERPWRNFIDEVVLSITKKADKNGFRTASWRLQDAITISLLVDIDAIVCYPGNVHWYDNNFLNKKIITVERAGA